MNARWMVRMGATLLVRPALWGVALRQVRRLARPGWWRHRPWLPLPPTEYLAFRSVTQYGDDGATPQPADVLTWLRWARRFPA